MAITIRPLGSSFAGEVSGIDITRPMDNRTTMHRGRRFDGNEVRDVRRTTLARHVPTVEQEQPA